MSDRQSRQEAPNNETVDIAAGFALPVPFVAPPAPFVAPPATEPLTPKEIITIPARHNSALQRVPERVNADEDLHAIWRCQNVTPSTASR